MILKQYYLGCLAHASYLIADTRSHQAVVVDPQRDIDQYLKDCEELGCSIRFVILTHFHADFLAGHIELRNQSGAKILMGRRAKPEFDAHFVVEGETIQMGDVRLEFLETPGHTPEGISILVFDLQTSDTRPHAVLTGDTLFIGDVGRPDLLASIGVTADELAAMLFDSLRKLRELPDATLVYPAHGAGSLCGRSLGKETVSTIGEQKRFNYALQPMSFEAFRQLVTSDQPEAPDYFGYDAIRNRQERPDLASAVSVAKVPLTLDTFLRYQRDGAQVLDVRAGIDFEASHLVGSLHIGLDGKYATWCGTLLSHDRPILLIADPGTEEEAIVRLGRIGFDHILGYLKDGMRALEQHPERLSSIRRITAAALAEQIAGTQRPVVLDVRTETERAAAHIKDSVSIPLSHLKERIAEIPSDSPIVVHCEGGYRSAIAASLLAEAGRTNVFDLVGGIKAWIASQLPTVSKADGPSAACSLKG